MRFYHSRHQREPKPPAFLSTGIGGLRAAVPLEKRGNFALGNRISFVMHDHIDHRAGFLNADLDRLRARLDRHPGSPLPERRDSLPSCP